MVAEKKSISSSIRDRLHGQLLRSVSLIWLLLHRAALQRTVLYNIICISCLC